jgi:hypothetical protein
MSPAIVLSALPRLPIVLGKVVGDHPNIMDKAKRPFQGMRVWDARDSKIFFKNASSTREILVTITSV